MADGDVDDICRVLALCFRDGKSLSELDIERILSFDMGWLSPEDAGLSVRALIDCGWLIGEGESLQSVVEENQVNTPLGWFPRPSRLIHPVRYDSNLFKSHFTGIEESEIIETELQQSKINTKVGKIISTNNPRARMEVRLKKFVAKQSKLTIEEIERRMQRKKHALGMVSEWMCIALIAREQGLMMKDIVDALSSNQAKSSS